MLETITAQNRPEAQYAWRGPSMLILDNEGKSGTRDFQGYYFRETRFLRDLRLEIDRESAFLSAAARVAPNEVAFTYVHPKVPLKGAGSGTGGRKKTDGILQRDLDLYLRYRVRPASIEATLEIANRWQEAAQVELAWVLSADYADIDGTKGPAGRRKQDAVVLAEPVENGVEFRYQHEKLPFETHVAVEGGGSWSFEDGRLSARISLERQKRVEIRLVARAIDPEDPIDAASERKREEKLEQWLQSATRLYAPGETPLVSLVNEHVHTLGSLALLDGKEEDWMAPAAGIPLYPSYWARDAMTAGWQAAMWDRGELVAAALPTANRLQGTKVDERRAEQPGRIIRQHRRDPRSRLGKTPFDRFYADFSSPFMFILSLGNAYAWSGERKLLERHYDACRRVLDWARNYADRDGDGYVEYLNPSKHGPPHEGWKDSGNAVVYEDGRQVKPPIAPAEIQGYWYAALQFAAVFSAVVGSKEDALAYWNEAKKLKQRFNRDFWVEEEGVPGFGLDSEKRLIKSVVSNAGHCLTTGIIEDEKLPRVVRRLFQPDMFSGWGIRTLSAKNPAYNPQSYHLGSVWAVENGTILFGLRRFGFDDRAIELARALYDLARIWDDGFIPEAVGGYDRHTHPFPGAYPRANSPQAWNLSQLPLLVQSLLGMRPVAALETLAVDPVLPPWLPELTLRDLRVGGATATLRFWRDEDGDSHHEVVEQSGTLHIVNQPPLDALNVGLWDRLGALAEGVLPF
jgi:glycogen debranching enzyme